jgi:hypothetical protein
MATSVWPFEDPRNCAVFATREVIRGDEPILFVSHDGGDDSWSFIGTSDGTLHNGMIVALEEAVALDPTVAQLADLPIGWCAHRSSPNGRWIREPQPDAI